MNKRNGQEGPWVFPKTRASRAEYLEFVKVLQGVGTTCSRFLLVPVVNCPEMAG